MSNTGSLIGCFALLFLLIMTVFILILISDKISTDKISNLNISSFFYKEDHDLIKIVTIQSFNILKKDLSRRT